MYKLFGTAVSLIAWATLGAVPPGADGDTLTLSSLEKTNLKELSNQVNPLESTAPKAGLFSGVIFTLAPLVT